MDDITIGTRVYKLKSFNTEGTGSKRIDTTDTTLNPPVLEISHSDKKGIKRTLIKSTRTLTNSEGIRQDFSVHMVLTRGNQAIASDLTSEAAVLNTLIQGTIGEDILKGII